MYQVYQWEYFTTLLDVSYTHPKVKDFLQKYYPDMKVLPKYMVETLTPQINEWASHGWELMVLEPVYVDNDGVIRPPGGATEARFLAVFRKLKQ
jgi:hypothetical protein